MITKLQADLADEVAAGGPKADRGPRIEAALRQAICENPASVEAYLLLGSIYRDQGDNLRAAALFRRLLEISPGHPRAAAELRTLPFGNIAFVKRPRALDLLLEDVTRPSIS